LAEIRPFAPEEAERAAPLFRALVPEQIQTGPAIRHWIESMPERARFHSWQAEVDGEIVGWCSARLRWDLDADDIAGGWVGVAATHRGTGLGSELARLAEDHARGLGARTLLSFVREDDGASRAFARRHGFREGRGDQSWALDVLRAALADPSVPQGVEVVRLGEVADRQRELFELFDAAHSDMPSDHTYTLRFEEWLPEALGDPALDFEVSAVVLVDGRPASFAWINSDRGSGFGANEMTGTHPAFRRRGLARLAKETSIRWAADAGLRTLLTSNDEANADMLALNEHLGYRPTHVTLELTKDLDGGEPGT
jgi:GNAT superfamily N-acetyltransferase